MPYHCDRDFNEGTGNCSKITVITSKRQVVIFIFPRIQRRTVNHYICVIWRADGRVGDVSERSVPRYTLTFHTDAYLYCDWLLEAINQQTSRLPQCSENMKAEGFFAYCTHVAFYLLNGMGNKPGTISEGKYRQWVSYSSESCTLQIKYLQNHKGTMQGSSTPGRTWKTSQHSPRRSKVSQKHKYKSTQVWSLRHIPFKLFLKRCWIIYCLRLKSGHV